MGWVGLLPGEVVESVPPVVNGRIWNGNEAVVGFGEVHPVASGHAARAEVAEKDVAASSWYRMVFMERP